MSSKPAPTAAVAAESAPADKSDAQASSSKASMSEVVTLILFNFFSSTGIVSANKLVYESGFTFAVTLTFIHFVCTTIGIFILGRLKVFTPKRLDIRRSLKLAIAGMGFVVFSNLSLQYNSVGFYQIMKHMTVVGVVIIEALCFRKFLAPPFLAALATMCIGVSITGSTDFKLNFVGTMFALANILCTSFYQIWCGSLQKSLDANSLQLQMYIAPLSALTIIPVIPIFDNYSLKSPNSIFQFVLTPQNASAILFTGVLALCVNVSIFLVIGKTSAVTYNVVGNGKTAFLFLVDFLIFGRPFEPANVFGMALTLTGVIWYSQLKLKANAEAEKADKSSQKWSTP